MDQSDHMTESEKQSPGQRLVGKVAVITGGARGIGGATAKLFARHGAFVVIADILDDQGNALANSIGARYIHCDVSNESDVESAIQLALSWKGQLDIMFSNAGIAGPGFSITNLKMDTIKPLFEININGNLHVIKHASWAMIKNETKGSIICTCSTAALMGGLGSHAYTLSKNAILGMARTSASELGVHGIRVNCVSPHGVPSQMLINAYRDIMRKDVTAEEVGQIVAESGSLLRGRAGSMEDVAQAVLYLASDESGYVTGHNLVIDGGYTCANRDMCFIYRGSME